MSLNGIGLGLAFNLDSPALLFTRQLKQLNGLSGILDAEFPITRQLKQLTGLSGILDAAALLPTTRQLKQLTGLSGILNAPALADEVTRMTALGAISSAISSMGIPGQDSGGISIYADDGPIESPNLSLCVEPFLDPPTENTTIQARIVRAP